MRWNNARNDEESIDVDFDIDENWSTDSIEIMKICVYVPVLDDYVDLAHSSDDRLQKIAMKVVLDEVDRRNAKILAENKMKWA